MHNDYINIEHFNVQFKGKANYSVGYGTGLGKNDRGWYIKENPIDNLELAYAISVHKSQGSEYPIVIFLCLQAHYVMLARNLFYTAISRAKQKVIVVGTKKAMAIAAKNDRQKTRYTRLKERLHIPVVQEDMDFPGEMDYEAEI